MKIEAIYFDNTGKTCTKAHLEQLKVQLNINWVNFNTNTGYKCCSH